MSALQRRMYQHMKSKGVILTDGSEQNKKVQLLYSVVHQLLGVLGSLEKITLFYTIAGVSLRVQVNG